jgi:hypothetical protein
MQTVASNWFATLLAVTDLNDLAHVSHAPGSGLSSPLVVSAAAGNIIPRAGHNIESLAKDHYVISVSLR